MGLLDPPAGNLTVEVINRNKDLHRGLVAVVKAVRDHRHAQDNGAHDMDDKLYTTVENIAINFPELFNA